MNDNRYALVVGTEPHSTPLENKLWEQLPLRRCAGPDHTICPLSLGLPCALRRTAAVSAVYLAGDDGRLADSLWKCALESDSPTIGVLPGTTEPWQVCSGLVIVGAGTGIRGIEAALEILAT